MYRMPSGDAAHLYEGKMHYKFIDIDATNRGHFESFFDYSLVRMKAPQRFTFLDPTKKDYGL